MTPPTNGLAGVGQNAPPRVRRYRSLNAVLEAGLFRSKAKILRPYRLIATMDTLPPLPSLVRLGVSLGLNIEPCVHLGVDMNQLAGRLEEKV